MISCAHFYGIVTRSTRAVHIVVSSLCGCIVSILIRACVVYARTRQRPKTPYL